MSVCVGSAWKILPITPVPPWKILPITPVPSLFFQSLPFPPCGVFWGWGKRELDETRVRGGRAKEGMGGEGSGKEGLTRREGGTGEGLGEGGPARARGRGRSEEGPSRGKLDGCIMHRVHTSLI
jgi:hypothetical protein